MSSPKQKDYGPSPGEKLQAGVAKAKYDEWNAVFKGVDDRNVSDARRDLSSTFKGRANADVVQSLGDASTGSTYRQTQNMSDIGGLWNAALNSQNLAANTSAGNVQAGLRSDAVEGITNRSGVLSANLAQGASIGNSNILNEAKNKLQVRNAYLNAGAKVLGQGIETGMENIGGGGSFFKANRNEGRMGQVDVEAYKANPNATTIPRYGKDTSKLSWADRARIFSQRNQGRR
tara:strand:- start:980 stop:1675 length:696 start_codon:yes stop_codon:yes gene_type:complete